MVGRPGTYRHVTRSGVIGFLFGLPFFAGGCFFVWGGLTAEEINGGPPTMALRLGFVAFASVFVLIGLAIMGGLRGIEVDPKRKLIRRWTGVFVPLRSTSSQLGDSYTVRIVKEKREHRSQKGGSRTVIVFVVKLIMEDDSVNVMEDRAYIKTRREGERLARTLKSALEDDASGERTVRDPEELDLSLKDILLRYGARPEMPVPEEGMRVRCRTRTGPDGMEAEITFPPLAIDHPKVARGFAIAFGVCLIALVALHWQTFQNGSLGDLFDRAFPTLILLGIAGVTLKVLRRGLATYRIHVTPRTILLSTSIVGLTQRRRIPVGELEELHIIPLSGKLNNGTGQLTAVGDHFLIEFAAYNPMLDLTFTEKMIQHVIGVK